MIALKTPIKKLFQTGFFHIVGAGSINKVLTMLLGIVLVRILSKTDYGSYAYAFNIVSFFIVINAFGASSAVMQICSELHEDVAKSKATYRYAEMVGSLVDVFMAISLIAIGIFAPLSVGDSKVLLFFYCLYPLLSFICEIRLTYLRVLLENKEYALMTNVQTLLMVALSLAGAFVYGVVGLVVAQSLAYFLSWLIIKHRTNKKGNFFPKITGDEEEQRLTKREKADYWKIALVSTFNIGVSNAVPLVGTLLVGVLLSSSADVADYKVATTIPFALSFVPGMITTYVYPFFVRNRNDRNWTIRGYAKLTFGSVALLGLIAVMFFVFAEPVIILVFGSSYESVTPAFRILLVGFFLSGAFRQPAGNLIVTQRKLGFNACVGAFVLVLISASSFLLIPLLGIIGAALAFTGSMLIGSIANTIGYIYYISKIQVQ